MLNGLSICSGIGGFELGFKLAMGSEYRTVCYVEIDPDCQRVLEAHMQDGTLDKAPIWDNLKTFDGERWRGRVDILHGGIPCQPFSIAGRRLGAADERDLWPDTLKLIRSVRPRIVLLENVVGLLHGKPGRSAYFGRILGDLAEAGYDARWEVLSAAEVGASHKRERVFVVAHDASRRSAAHGEEDRFGSTTAPCGSSGQLAHADRTGRGEQCGSVAGGQEQPAAEHDGGDMGNAKSGNARASLPAFPPAPNDAEGWRRVLDSRPDLAPAIDERLNPAFVEWLMGYPIGWTAAASRNARLRLLGNAIVPLCAAKVVDRMLSETRRTP